MQLDSWSHSFGEDSELDESDSDWTTESGLRNSQEIRGQLRLRFDVIG